MSFRDLTFLNIAFIQFTNINPCCHVSEKKIQKPGGKNLFAFFSTGGGDYINLKNVFLNLVKL